MRLHRLLGGVVILAYLARHLRRAPADPSLNAVREFTGAPPARPRRRGQTGHPDLVQRARDEGVTAHYEGMGTVRTWTP